MKTEDNILFFTTFFFFFVVVRGTNIWAEESASNFEIL